MGNALLQRAKDLVDHERRVELQKQKAEEAKKEMERLRSELQELLATNPAPRLDDTADGTMTRIVSSTLAAKLSGHQIGADVSAAMAQRGGMYLS